MMKKGLLVGITALFLLACGDGNVRIQVDPDVQVEKDSITIIEYLHMNGYADEAIGNTENGIRYVILDPGSMEQIDESDFVEFDYIGKTLGDTIFDTTIEVIGDSLRSHYEENPFVRNGDTLTLFSHNNYDPLFITYSSSGWSIPTGQGGFIPGFAEGIAATFKHLKVGGRALIVIPSGRAYGQGGSGVFIAPNTPIAFELRPVKVTKQ